MASTEGLVPITREFLARYYDKYTFTPLSEDVARLSAQLRAISDDLRSDCPLSPSDMLLVHEVENPVPHKMDENMWKNREHIEEILYLLESSHWPLPLQQQSTAEEIKIAAMLRDLRAEFLNTLKTLESFQSKNAEIVFNIVMSYMPQDFRGTLIRQQRERSERNKQAEVENLINSGGSIRDRYALLWKQQMERRRQLAQLGSASGVYKTLVKYLVGVPQVLLDFVKQINDDEGPMEEQRQHYGPFMYSLTNMVLLIRFFLHICWAQFEARKVERDKLALLEQAVHVYTSEFRRFLKFIGEVFSNSPFFITADEAGASESRKKDDFKETVILSGKTYEDIGFRVEYIGPNGEITPILPNQRFVSNQGNFSACMTGCYKLIWDNSYSTFLKKSLRYKVDSIPPVTEGPPLAVVSSEAI